MSNNDNIEFKKINEKLNIIYNSILNNKKINNQLSKHTLSFFIFLGLSFITNVFDVILNIYNMYFTDNYSKKFKIIYTIFFIFILLIFSIWASIIYTSERNKPNEINTGLEKIGITII